MEDLTLALITLTSFVLLFVVAIFADRAGLEAADELTSQQPEPVPVAIEDPRTSSSTAHTAHDSHADVA
ncbi:MAG: hypothetical protein KDC46_14115 [Thermoleophilia bacterium]|nr:hypothetical protein [Thermoleophilia bacterium]